MLAPQTILSCAWVPWLIACASWYAELMDYIQQQNLGYKYFGSKQYVLSSVLLTPTVYCASEETGNQGDEVNL